MNFYNGCEMGRYCCIKGCKSGPKSSVSLHRMPSAEEKMKVWIHNIQTTKKGSPPSRTTKVCSLHFPDGRPTNENPYPVEMMGHDDLISDLKPVQSSAWTNIEETVEAVIKGQNTDTEMVQTPRKFFATSTDGSPQCLPAISVKEELDSDSENYPLDKMKSTKPTGLFSSTPEGVQRRTRRATGTALIKMEQEMENFRQRNVGNVAMIDRRNFQTSFSHKNYQPSFSHSTYQTSFNHNNYQISRKREIIRNGQPAIGSENGRFRMTRLFLPNQEHTYCFPKTKYSDAFLNLESNTSAVNGRLKIGSRMLLVRANGLLVLPQQRVNGRTALEPQRMTGRTPLGPQVMNGRTHFEPQWMNGRMHLEPQRMNGRIPLKPANYMGTADGFTPNRVIRNDRLKRSGLTTLSALIDRHSLGVYGAAKAKSNFKRNLGTSYSGLCSCIDDVGCIHDYAIGTRVSTGPVSTNRRQLLLRRERMRTRRQALEAKVKKIMEENLKLELDQAKKGNAKKEKAVETATWVDKPKEEKAMEEKPKERKEAAIEGKPKETREETVEVKPARGWKRKEAMSAEAAKVPHGGVMILLVNSEVCMED